VRASKRILVCLSSHELMSGDALRGIVAYQAAHPYLRLEFGQVDVRAPNPGRTLRENIALVRPDGVLACIFWPGARRDYGHGPPLVNIDDSLKSPFPSVIPDHARMGELAAEHLLAQNLPQYGFVSVTGRGYGSFLRWRGFRGRLARAGHTCYLFDDAFPDTARELNETDLRQWVAGLPKPIGIHAVYLNLAVRIFWACRAMGIRVPEDVAVIGGHDSPVVANALAPTISAINVHHAAIGHEAMRLLDRLVHGKRAPAKPVLLPVFEIMPRQSSDVRGSRDPEVARIRRMIAERSHRPLVVKELLAHTTLSRRALERRFKRQMGHSLHNEIVAAHMVIAERLLRQTLLRPMQVARQSGYASYRIFAAAFRKHTGLTATAFRQRHAALPEAGCVAKHHP